MTIQKFEQLVLNELATKVSDIIESNLSLNIPVKGRQGAEISDWLEEQFITHTKSHLKFSNSVAAPKNKTKNPWDVKTYFNLNKSYKEEIWIDFKAFDVLRANSNPKIGTPNKMLNLISQGGFYLTYIYVYYQKSDSGMQFVKHNNSYVKCYFLKDVNSSFYRDSTNQLQVNFNKEPQYRTRSEFINLLRNKLRESYSRQIERLENEKNGLDALFDTIEERNSSAENTLINNL
mgnify:CR=1 FL=1